MTADRYIFAIVLILSFVGLVMVYDASVVSAIRDFSDQYHYIRNQSMWLLAGIVGMLILSRIDYHVILKIATPLFLVSLILLVLVLIPGIGNTALGVKRWISILGLTIQPAEFVKLTTIIFFTSLFAHVSKITTKLFVWILATEALLLALIMLEPDMGTGVIVVMIGIVLLFVAGAPWRYFLGLVPIGLMVATGLIAAAPYRMKRFTTFLNPFSDILASGYHINQVLIALGSGGALGLGLGQSRQKYAYLPEATTDSIFAIMAEEVGFLGASCITLAFLLLIWRGIRIACKAKDTAGKLLVCGITTWIGMQAFVNIGAMVALIPLTGVPLPFISYGGSALVTMLLGVGILLNVSRSIA